jgi:hypothetical protein
MTDCKLDAWQKICLDYCDDCEAPHYTTDEGECIAEDEVEIGPCMVHEVKNVLNGKTTVPDKAEAIMQMVVQACETCRAGTERGYRDCENMDSCFVEDLKVVGEGKQ